MVADRSRWWPRMRILALLLGLVLFVLVLVGVNPVPERPEVGRTLAVAVLMAMYWLTEAVPLAVTALFPVVLLPLFAFASAGQVAAAYMNDIIFLFLGGFMLAIGMQTTGLDRRIALRILVWIGKSPAMILLGVMGVTWMISWWVSNTASMLIMIPIILSLVGSVEHEDRAAAQGLTRAMLLGAAYAASVGGMATLIGTPPNLVFSRVYAMAAPGVTPVTFLSWMLMAAPVSVVMFVLLFLYFRATALRGCAVVVNRGLLRRDYAGLGRMPFEQRVVMVLFFVFVALVVTRADLTLGDTTVRGWASRGGFAGRVGDGVVAVGVAILLFMVPARSRPGPILDASAFGKLPWDVVILFGGGFALADAFQRSGLSDYLGASLGGLAGVPPLLMIFLLVAGICFLGELASNTALAQVSLPVLAALATAKGMHPLLLMLPATLAASCGFMLPVATPPNTIVYGTHRVTARDMMRAGWVVDWIGIVLVTLFTYTWTRWVLGLDFAAAR
ncbi:MAG: SLC13 family permease [Candidatus Krumholzibacteria bacterium]|nr:SLC13 family permease [Candidatus Krumholzibacteria bacterium]MDH4337471.1 SLC13 family permease [Candidatus Krumholzibacteria bacterium]MDH5270149.1 SLC13 family permease [Candidatus Krumholzibacteria bacterium]